MRVGTVAKSPNNQFTFLGANRIFAPGASATVSYDGKNYKDVESWVSQSKLDVGSTVADAASLSSADIIAMGAKVLAAPNGPSEPPTAIVEAAVSAAAVTN